MLQLYHLSSNANVEELTILYNNSQRLLNYSLVYLK